MACANSHWAVPLLKKLAITAGFHWNYTNPARRNLPIGRLRPTSGNLSSCAKISLFFGLAVAAHAVEEAHRFTGPFSPAAPMANVEPKPGRRISRPRSMLRNSRLRSSSVAGVPIPAGKSREPPLCRDRGNTGLPQIEQQSTELLDRVLRDTTEFTRLPDGNSKRLPSATGQLHGRRPHSQQRPRSTSDRARADPISPGGGSP
jgi:hypothetical protein